MPWSKCGVSYQCLRVTLPECLREALEVTRQLLIQNALVLLILQTILYFCATLHSNKTVNLYKIYIKVWFILRKFYKKNIIAFRWNHLISLKCVLIRSHYYSWCTVYRIKFKLFNVSIASYFCSIFWYTYCQNPIENVKK